MSQTLLSDQIKYLPKHPVIISHSLYKLLGHVIDNFPLGMTYNNNMIVQ